MFAEVIVGITLREVFIYFEDLKVKTHLVLKSIFVTIEYSLVALAKYKYLLFYFISCGVFLNRKVKQTA